MKGIFKRTFGSFEPIDENAQKIFKKYSFGDEIELDHKASRNIKFHRMFFAMINLTFQNQDITDNQNDFREAVTIAAGYYHYQKQIDGSKIKRADSISFDNMDDLKFKLLYNDVFDICLKILGTTSEELERELLRFN